MKIGFALSWLLSWLFPGVDGDDDDALPDEPPPDDDPAPGEDDPPQPPGDDEDVDLPDPDEIAAQRAARRQAAPAPLDPTAVAIEAARAAVAAARPPAPPPRDPEWEREEAILRNPEADDWTKFAAQTQRQLRETGRRAAQAERAAADAADKGAFYAKFAGNQKIAKFLPQVEQEVARLTSAGGAPPREEVLHWVLGKAYAKALESGGAKPRAAKSGGAAPAGKSVNRGQPAGVRSDVGRNNSNERNRLRERLKNVQL